MFPPSIESILGAAHTHTHYRTVLTRDAIAIEASGPDDHALAMEFLREAMREGWPNGSPSPAHSLMHAVSIPPPHTVPAPVIPSPSTPLQQVPQSNGAPEKIAEPSTLSIESSVQAHDSALPDTPSTQRAGGPTSMASPTPSTNPYRPREHPVDQVDSAERHRIHHRAAKYRAGLTAVGKPSTTIEENRFVTDVLIDLIGNKPVAEVTEDDIHHFVDEIKHWPANVGRSKAFAGISRLDVLKQAKLKKLKSIGKNTIAKHLKTLITFFNVCKGIEGTGVKHSPCDWIKLKHYRDKRGQKRDDLSQEERQLILDECMNKTNPLEFWGFRIAELTSMRANEVCQLELDDIRSMTWTEYGGVKKTIHYFNISDQGEGQHVKSNTSVRHLPIPQALIDDGFLRYVDDVRKQGGKHLFPGLSWNAQRPGRALSTFINPLLRKKGITSKRKVLHSTRNTWTTEADLACLPRSVIRGVNGHSDGSDVDDGYTTRAHLETLQAYMEKMDRPYLQFRPYRPALFVDAIKAGVAREKRDERLRAEGMPLNRRPGRP